MFNCNFCNNPLEHVFVDLYHQPASNSFLSSEQLNEPETYYPLKVFVCDKCFLVQVPEHKKATEIFQDEYIYFSSQSPSNVEHAKESINIMVERFNLNENSFVVEIGSNDGYLLQHIYKKIPCIGIDPSKRCAEEAIRKGIITLPKFFSSELAKTIDKADLIYSINTLAHQPDINDFVKGVKIALKPDGVAVFEFPYLQNLIDKCQYDTIYLEHYSYFSFMSVCTIFNQNGLTIFDVEQIPEHGGSLRIYAQHENRVYPESVNVAILLGGEVLNGMNTLLHYSGFKYKIAKVKTDLVSFLIRQKKYGKAVVGYGAAAKGNTLLGYCGIRSDLLPFIVDRSPHKQGKYTPGSHIKIVDEAEIKKYKPEYILILAWNLCDEIEKQLSYARRWNVKFVVAIPELTIW